MGKSKDLATLKDSGLSIDGTLTTTTQVQTLLDSSKIHVVKIQTDKDDYGQMMMPFFNLQLVAQTLHKGEMVL